MKISLLLIILFFGIPIGFAQTDNQLEILIDGMAENDEEELRLLLEEMNDCLANPLTFRTMSKESLSAIPFLSKIQTDALLLYRDTSAEKPTWLEVFSVIQFSPQQREILPYLISLSDSTVQHTRPRTVPRVNMILSFWRDMEKAKGYFEASGTQAFIGSPFGNRLRGQISGRDFTMKAIAESDPGESGFPEPDHRSAGFAVHPVRHCFQLYFGDYHLSSGQGLGMGTRPVFRSWKADPQLQLRRSRGFSLHAGSNENRFLRGGAAQFASKKIIGRVFFSSKNLDVSLLGNENGNNFISGLYSSGLHRSKSEILKKDVVSEDLAGLELDYSGRRFELGTFFIKFDLSNDFRIPNKISPDYTSTEFVNEACRYSLWFRHLLGGGMLVGELASSSTGGSAFSFTYSSFFSGGLAYLVSFERSEPAFFMHYTSSGSSLIKAEGNQMGRINILYQPGRSWGAQTEFQLNTNINPALEKALAPDFLFKARGFYKSDFWEVENWTQLNPGQIKSCIRFKGHDSNSQLSWQAETGLSASGFQNLYKKPSTYLSLRGRYVCRNELFRIQGGISLFSRNRGSGVFYIYEPDVLYGMSLPALSGTGSRVFFLVQYQILKSLKFELKLSRLDYDDRDEIGTGLDRIPFNHRTSVKVQMVYRPQW